MMKPNNVDTDSHQTSRRLPPRIGVDLNATQSLTEASSLGLSFDYSTDTTSDHETATDAIDDDLSRSSTQATINQKLLTDLKTELEEARIQRDYAIEQTTEAKKTLSVVMEAVQILCRQMKSSTFVEFQQPLECSTCTPKTSSTGGGDDDRHSTTTDGRLQMDIDELQTKSSQMDDTNQMMPTIIATPKANRERTSSGVSTTSISSYTSEDSQRLSQLLIQSSNSLDSNFSKIGSDLMALNGACLTIDQNARHISDESSTILRDLQHATSQLHDMKKRCRAAEKCAKKLYNENQLYRKELERNRAERKWMVQEIKTLRAHKDDTEAFQNKLVESMKSHEMYIKNQLVMSKVKPDSRVQVGVSEVKAEGGMNNANDAAENSKEPIEAGTGVKIPKGKDSSNDNKGADSESKTLGGSEKSPKSGGFNPFGILKALPFGSNTGTSSSPTSKNSTDDNGDKAVVSSTSPVETKNKKLDENVPEGSNENGSNMDSTATSNSNRTKTPKSTLSPVRAPLQLKSASSNARNAQLVTIRSTISLEEMIGLKSSPSSSSSTWVRQANSPTGASKRAIVKVKVKLPKNKDTKT